MRPLRGALVLAISCAFAREAPAQGLPVTLDTITVTVTRSTRSVLGSPFALSVTYPDDSRPGTRRAALDESLAIVPGVIAVNRSNPSQDPRLSIRGFGARSAFGVRGVRILRDGIPLTLPDGQTPVDYLSLESVGRMEIMRGAASAMYGNASGGVVEIVSRAAEPGPLHVQARQWLGSDHYLRSVVAASGSSGSSGSASYVTDVAHSRSDGFREHSRQRATTLFARAGAAFSGTDLSVTVLGLDNPLAENPGALTREELETEPGRADPLNLRRSARKVVSQLQAGASASRRIAGAELSLIAYAGARSLDNPLSFAVVDLDRRSHGLSGSIRTGGVLGARSHRFAGGFDLQAQSDVRRNFTNCADTLPVPVTIACPEPGRQRGALTLDQRELVRSVGVYASDELAIGGPWSATIGARADNVRFEVRDRLVTSANPDDSGARSMGAVTPVVGVLARLSPAHTTYANVSAAFETPTATELGNQPDGSAGLNPVLAPQRSRTVEAGVKGRLGPLSYDAALFRTSVRAELIPFEIPGSDGRRYFRNAGRTLRRGAEAGVAISFGHADLAAAYAHSDFSFRDYVVGGADHSGKVIPGVPRARVQGSATVRRGEAFMTADVEAAGRAWLDDANSTRAPGYAVFGVRVGTERQAWGARLSVSAGIQNLLDRVYASSLSVNAARGRYFEPAPPRGFFVGITASRWLNGDDAGQTTNRETQSGEPNGSLARSREVEAQSPGRSRKPGRESRARGASRKLLSARTADRTRAVRRFDTGSTPGSILEALG